MPEVVTLGETMVLFSPDQQGPLRYIHHFSKRIAGAESNVAIGLARLGHSSGWIGNVGEDEFGEFVVREIRAEGVDVSRVRKVKDAPTGIMFKELNEGRETKVTYYRRLSAASRMVPDELDREYIRGARLLHISGITPALSSSCLETVFEAASIARSGGVKVCFDPNIRLKLWSAGEAAETIKSILPLADIVLPGIDEGRILFGADSADEIIDQCLRRGAEIVALKLGANGCIVSDANQRHQVSPFAVGKILDTVGAGDAFAAGFIAGLLENMPLIQCGRLANAMGAFAVTVSGDIEGLPVRGQLEQFMQNEMGISR